ncbi:MAG: hypothetical protein WBA74_24735 [Cyclobacteriaceae bacterium]
MTELHEQIEQYVSGKMPASEQEDFESQLKVDPVLDEQVTLYRQADDVFSNTAMTDFALTLEDVKQEYKNRQQSSPGKNRQIPPFVWYGIAASVLLFLIGLAFWPTSPTDSLAWDQENYTPYPAQVQRNADSNYPEPLRYALIAYREKQYNQAVLLLDPFTTDDYYGSLASFYKAQALMASGEIQKAIPLWETQLAGTETAYRQSIQWYLALCYIRNEEIPKARTLASEILATPAHAYEDSAKKLLNNFPS